MSACSVCSCCPAAFGAHSCRASHTAEEFDRDFIIKGTEERKLRALFDNARLRELIAAQPQIHLTVKDDEGGWGRGFPADTDELCFHVCGIIKEVDRLYRNLARRG